MELIQLQLLKIHYLYKLQYKNFENQFVNSNSGVQNIANTLARNYMLKGNTNLINEELDIYRSITREDIRNAAIKYLQKNKRVDMDYLPKKSEQ